jgi:signal transduction histidine kinase
VNHDSLPEFLERSNNRPSGGKQQQVSQTERQLIDDLHVHQIELEMQNQELGRAKADLEHSRARYLDLFDFAPVAYFALTPPRGTIESLNLAAGELLKTDRGRAIGTLLVNYFDSASQGAFRAHLDVVLSGFETQSLDLVLAARAGESARHVHLMSRLVRGENRDHPICLCAMIDITARKKSEEDLCRLNATLEQNKAELEEMNRDLEAFAYSTSHDLRAPLRNMVGFAQILAEDLKDQLPSDAINYANRILRANQKMLLLVDELLRFSRLGRKPLDLRPVDFNELVDDAISSFGDELRHRKIEWRRLPLPIVDCDRPLMLQVFVNLLSNALKFSRSRHPAIITIGTDLHQGHRAVFIRDNGVGFDMRYRDKLFGVFSRLHPESAFEGTGVGLAMVARILSRHGGRAWADGAVNEGATFWFTLKALRILT